LKPSNNILNSPSSHNNLQQLDSSSNNLKNYETDTENQKSPNPLKLTNSNEKQGNLEFLKLNKLKKLIIS
jgi:hypothetical protein